MPGGFLPGILTATGSRRSKGNRTMSKKPKGFLGWLRRRTDDPEAAELAEFLEGLDTDNDTDKEPTTVDFTKSPEWLALQKKIADQEAQLAKFSAETATKTAEQAVAKLKAKVTPAQRPALEALFTQLAKDDAADAQTVTFSVEGESDFTGSRVEAALAFFSATGNIVLTAETLDEEKATFNADSSKKKPVEIDPQKIHENYLKNQMGGK